MDWWEQVFTIINLMLLAELRIQQIKNLTSAPRGKRTKRKGSRRK